MNTDLISIKQSTALEVLSSPDQVAKIIEEVKVKINTLDGGTLETGVGRKKIITNANKAKKSKIAVCKYIDDLVLMKKVEIRDKTLDENETIRLLLESKTALSDGLDAVYKETRQAVTDFEANIKAEKAEKAKAEAKAELKKTIDSDHEIAFILMAHDFKEREEAKAKADQQALADKEKIKAEAAETARIEAEQKAANEIKRAEREKQAAIKREADAKASEAKAKQDAIDAEERRKKQQIKSEADAKKAKAQAKRDNEAAAEKAKQTEIKRQQAITKAAEAEQAARNADSERTKAVRRNARDLLIARHNLSPEVAQAIIVDIHKKIIPGLSINY